MNDERHIEHDDPIGLRDLPLLEPDRDGWADIRAALEADRAGAHRRVGRRLALAACLALVAGLVIYLPFHGGQPAEGPQLAEHMPSTNNPDTGLPTTEDTQPALDTGLPEQPEASLGELVALSQVLEQRLRALREDNTAMPAESAVYVAELEDLVAQVDNELSVAPDSIDLWGQRVNLLLDLESLFQHQFEREYGRMASL